jgi:beta-1,4-mannosyl-glycoprotein beta-1,4-N-acetylglucosaminyltransferase
MVYDVFQFNGELEMLDIRLNILKDYVDQFVLVEAEETFSGKPKPLYYEENKEKFSKFNIRYYRVGRDYGQFNQMAKESPTVTNEVWHREFCQKESIQLAIKDLKDEDICYIGDVDEIWKPKIIGDRIYRLRQNVYAYYFNNLSSEPWFGPIVSHYGNIKNRCLNHLKTRYPWSVLEDGGWHFTNQFGAGEIKRKLESYGHQEYNTDDIKASLERKIKENQDYIGRHFSFKTDNNIPDYILKNYPQWLKLAS